MSNSMFYSTMGAQRATLVWSIVPHELAPAAAMKPEIVLSAPPYAVLWAVAHVSELLQVLRHYTGGRWSLGPVELLTPATLGLMKLVRVGVVRRGEVHAVSGRGSPHTCRTIAFRRARPRSASATVPSSRSRVSVGVRRGAAQAHALTSECRFTHTEALHKTVELDKMMRANGGKTPKRTHW